MSHSPHLDDDQQSVHQEVEPTLQFTLIRSEDVLTKYYEVNDGKPQVMMHPFLSRGKALRVFLSCKNFHIDFSQFLTKLDAYESIVLGALVEEVPGEMADITTKERHRPSDPGDGSPLIWRGKAWLGYRTAMPCVLGLDCDSKGMPPELRERVDACGGVMSVLHSVCPALARAACVSRPSTSTGIIAVDTGEATPGGAWHFYFAALDGGDAYDFICRLHTHLVLAGWGFPFVTDAGAVQIRSLIDTVASGVGERLWFEADARLGEGLERVAGARDPVATPGQMLDTKQALAPLTVDETDRLRSVNVELRAAVADEAASKRQCYAKRIHEQIVQRGEDDALVPEVVECLLDADSRGVLHGRHLLHLDDGRIVSVQDILADRREFHRATCADPLEPTYGGGTNKAILYTDGYHPRLFSHAHGSRLFTLALDEVDVIDAVNTALNEGRDPVKLVQKIAPEVIFAAGGWSQVEAETGWKTANALGGAELIPGPLLGSHNGGVQSETGSDLTTVVREPLMDVGLLDPEPVVDLLMRDFDSRFAIVAEGGSTGVVRLAYNAELGRRMPVTMTLDAFKLLYGNQYIQLPSATRKSGVENVSAPMLWLKHSARRTCPDGFGIDPTGNLPETVFNLWQGYGVEECEGDWSKLNQMIFDILAAGDQAHYIYITMWLAHLVQRPHESPGVALVFRGEEGTGKGTLGRALMRLMRPHAMQITHSKHLTGAFNAHMRTVLFMFADEAFFAADRAQEGALKGLITEDYRVNEGKGRDATLGRNRIHLMMASNNEWVVPAGATARRFAVFDVSSAHRQDQNYFGPILAEMDVDGKAAGVAAMLYDLRRIVLDNNLVRKAPETAGVHAQRIASLRGPARWMFDVLVRGYVGSFSEEQWREHYSTEELFDSYRSWATDTRENFPADRHAIDKFLASMFQPCRPRMMQSAGGKRPPSYRFGLLREARRVFVEKHGIGDAWPDDETPEDAQASS